MRLTTNIAFNSDRGTTQSYVVEYMPSDDHQYSEFLLNIDDLSRRGATLFNSRYQDTYLIKDVNDWYTVTPHGQNSYLMKDSIVRLYFPQYSVDTYNSNCTYVAEFFTYIHGIKISLGNFVFQRKNSLACVPIRFGGMDEYYEYMDFHIADPRFILSDESMDEFRGLFGQTDDSPSNPSLLGCGLFVVEWGEDSYIKQDGWTGGQNSIPISDPEDLSLHCWYNVENREICLDITFNSVYEGNIEKYLKENYNCKSASVVLQYVIMDDSNVYHERSVTIDNITNPSYRFPIDSSTDEMFDSWNGWKEGLLIKATALFFMTGNQDDFPSVMLMSNRIPVSQELFSKMIKSDGYNVIPSKINLDDLQMNNVNLTAINKIEQNTQTKTPIDIAKNHIIQPVFYQTRDLTSTVIHPSVTENIAINLDSYKSQVTQFKLQVEGIHFNEIGRTGRGVIFKIYGNMLPKKSDEGTLFILDQNNELVTSGKYIYSY